MPSPLSDLNVRDLDRPPGRAWFVHGSSVRPAVASQWMPVRLLVALIFGLILPLGLRTALAQSPGPTTAVRTLTLEETVRRVVENNESVQIRELDHEISRRLHAAERGIFEPQIVTSVDRVDNQRENNLQQQRSLFSSQFSERNTIYNGGLEFLAPSGARLRGGLTLRDLRNSLQRDQTFLGTNLVDREYEWFGGISLTQPLLKGFGKNATTVRVRLAALASDVAFQEYRRQLMLMVSQAEATYWDLYLTQEQERLTAESVQVAEKILGDNTNRVALGRSSELEVVQARAGVALRRARANDARMKRLQAAAQLDNLFSTGAQETNALVLAADSPAVRDDNLTYFESYAQAFDLNPDYLARRIEIQQENIRLAFAKNQKLPQLDLKASYGLNGLGATPAESWDDLSRTDFPSWSVGFELRIPVTGGVRERNELEAAKLSKQKALLSLKDIEVQISNALRTALTKVAHLRENIRNYQSVVDFHQQVLNTDLSRLDVGRIDSRAVLETEEKLFEARLAVVDLLVQYKKAMIELALVSGASLQLRNLDLTKPQLATKTAARVQQGRWSTLELERLARDAEKGAPVWDMSPANLDRRRAQERLREDMKPPAYAPMTEEERARAIESLRREMKAIP